MQECPHCTLYFIRSPHFQALPASLKIGTQTLPTLLPPNLILPDAGRQLTCVRGRLFPLQENAPGTTCVWSQAWLILTTPPYWSAI